MLIVLMQVWLAHQSRSQPSAANAGSLLWCWPIGLQAEQPWRLEAASFVQAFQIPSSTLQVRLCLNGMSCILMQLLTLLVGCIDLSLGSTDLPKYLQSHEPSMHVTSISAVLLLLHHHGS